MFSKYFTIITFLLWSISGLAIKLPTSFTRMKGPGATNSISLVASDSKESSDLDISPSGFVATLNGANCILSGLFCVFATEKFLETIDVPSSAEGKLLGRFFGLYVLSYGALVLSLVKEGVKLTGPVGNALSLGYLLCTGGALHAVKSGLLSTKPIFNKVQLILSPLMGIAHLVALYVNK